jgi:hypothetical protein
MSDAHYIFLEPSGDGIRDLPASEIITLMRQNDDEYWGPYSPVAIIEWGSPPLYSLFFVRHPRRGWYFEYSSYQEPKRNLVAVQPTEDRPTWVEHWAEGETAFFLASCFLPQAIAERIVTDFLNSQQPTPTVHWEEFHWTVHRRESPPDDESDVVELADPEG